MTDYLISEQLLITTIQVVQNATHPNVPYATVSRLLQELTALPPATTENHEPTTPDADDRGTAGRTDAPDER
jgi:hypothetical protein